MLLRAIFVFFPVPCVASIFGAVFYIHHIIASSPPLIFIIASHILFLRPLPPHHRHCHLLIHGKIQQTCFNVQFRGDVGCGWFIAAISGKFELVCGSGFDFKGEYIGNHGFHITYGGVMCCPVSMFPSFLGEMLEGTEAAMTARHERIHGWLQYPANGFPDLRTERKDGVGWDTVGKTMGFVFSKYGTKWETLLPGPELPIKSHPSTPTFITMFLGKSHKIHENPIKSHENPIKSMKIP